MTEFTDPWLHFLTRQGARIDLSTGPDVCGFDDAPVSDAPLTNFVAPLTDLGLISVIGDDAASFLHNQLTNDVEHLGPAEARLAGYCSPKGRLLATFLMWKSPEAVFLELPRQIQATVQKRLQMFVLRAKAKLADASDSHVILGLCGTAASTLLQQWFAAIPSMPYGRSESDQGTLIRMADVGGEPRYQWITTIDVAKSAWPVLSGALRAVGTHVWRLAEIRAGIPQITQATQEQFVPQMINFEAIGGVNFKKGCYPGQEIVARSQYLGKLKRRMMLASIATSGARAGMEIFAAADPDQPCGMVVNAEAAAAGQFDCLVEIKIALTEGGTIHLGSPDGPTLEFKPLPYALPEPA